MEREVGGGIGMGNTCKPMAVSFQCMTKFTTNKKKIKKRFGRVRSHQLRNIIADSLVLFNVSQKAEFFSFLRISSYGPKLWMLYIHTGTQKI